jgi:hypothetical protein
MKVGKLSLGSLIMATLLMSALSARANQITFEDSTQPLTFSGMGSSTMLSLTLGTCTKGACVLSGLAVGDDSLASVGTYSFISAPGSLSLNFITSSANESEWSVTQNKPIVFQYGTNGSLLNGDLTLLTFQETSKQGTFNYDEELNLTVTGGSLANVFGSNGTADLLITFSSNQDIDSMRGTGSSGTVQTAHISSGELVPLVATPEPGSASTVFLALVIMGVGGTILRGKRSFSQRAS